MPNQEALIERITERAIDCADGNFWEADDQIGAYENWTDCFWAYRQNLEDTLEDRGYARSSAGREAFRLAYEHFDDLAAKHRTNPAG